MTSTDAMITLCRLVDDAKRAGGGFGPFLARRGAPGGLYFNAGGEGAFLGDEDLDALAEDDYVDVIRDLRGDGTVTILDRAIRECGGTL